MIFKVFTVFDSKVEAYLQPFFMPAKGAAIRAFTEIVCDVNHAFGKHPEDYTLFEIGSFDDSNAKLDMYPTPLSLGVGIEFVKTP